MYLIHILSYPDVFVLDTYEIWYWHMIVTLKNSYFLDAFVMHL
jgi:hypothetical protein